jgi:hypothetical protein
MTRTCLREIVLRVLRPFLLHPCRRAIDHRLRVRLRILCRSCQSNKAFVVQTGVSKNRKALSLLLMEVVMMLWSQRAMRR